MELYRKEEQFGFLNIKIIHHHVIYAHLIPSREVCYLCSFRLAAFCCPSCMNYTSWQALCDQPP